MARLTLNIDKINDLGSITQGQVDFVMVHMMSVIAPLEEMDVILTFNGSNLIIRWHFVAPGGKLNKTRYQLVKLSTIIPVVLSIPVNLCWGDCGYKTWISTPRSGELSE